MIAVSGKQEQEQRDSQTGKCLQHIRTALQCTEFHDLGAACFMRAFFGLQGHCGKTDCKAVIGNDLHLSVINQHKAKLLRDDIYDKQRSSA